MKKFFTIFFTLFAGILVAQTTAVWNPAANPDSDGLWSTAANWTTNVVPDGDFKVVFNVPDAQDAKLNDTRTITQFVLGDNGPGNTLIIQDGGALTTSPTIWSAVGYNDTARLVVETGGAVSFGEHMWLGFEPTGYGIVEVNGGVINVGAMTGLGWNGGTAFLYVNDGVVNMTGFDPNMSIRDGSLIDIDNGAITIPGDQSANVQAYVDAGKITAFGGSGEVVITYDSGTNLTTVTATSGPQATTVWNPAGNPQSTGLWSEAANWTDGFVPDGNKVVFNVPGAADAVLDYNAPAITQFVLGDNGPGGTLIVADGGVLSTSSTIWSAVGYNDTARLVVETGGAVSFGEHMWLGFEPTGYGIVEVNGGTINVGAMTGLGWNGGTAFLYVNDGVVNMTGFDPNMSIGDGSLIDISNGTITINGDQTAAVEAYVAANKITAFGGTGTVIVTFDQSTGRTIVTADETNDVVEQTAAGLIRLRQNYPNPFNGFTTLGFELPESSRVRLTIYTLTGRKVAELVNETMIAGTHEVQWDASSLPSGNYVVQMQVNLNMLTQRVTLLK